MNANVKLLRILPVIVGAALMSALFDESMRGTYKPVFHLLQVRLPVWTVFYDNEKPRPIWFVSKDTVSREGFLMQF